MAVVTVSFVQGSQYTWGDSRLRRFHYWKCIKCENTGHPCFLFVEIEPDPEPRKSTMHCNYEWPS